jgi:hypothetical protein
MIILGLLPFLVLILLTVVCSASDQEGSYCAVDTLLLWGVGIVLGTEVLTIFKALSPLIVSKSELSGESVSL